MDSPNDESTFTPSDDILLVPLLEKFNVLLKHFEVDSNLGGINQICSSLDSARPSVNETQPIRKKKEEDKKLTAKAPSIAMYPQPAP